MQQKNETINPGVSIIICTYNGEKRLPETIRHLCRQDVPEGINWEVIVINNASTDNTKRLAWALWNRNDISIRVIDEINPGLSNARYRGIQEAKYEFISFVDDDNWVEPNWVATVYEILSTMPEVGMCGGEGFAKCEVEPPEWFENYKSNYAIGKQGYISCDITDTRGYLHGAGISLRKSVLLDIIQKGFKQQLLGRNGKILTAGDDSELCYVLRLAGWRLWYDERLRFIHFIPKNRLNWEYFLNMQHGFGKSHVFLEMYLKILEQNNYKLIYKQSISDKIKTLFKIFIQNYWKIFNKSKYPGDSQFIYYYWYLGYIKQLFQMKFKMKKRYEQLLEMLENIINYTKFPRIKEFHKKYDYKWNDKIIFDEKILPFLKKGFGDVGCFIDNNSNKLNYIEVKNKKLKMEFQLNKIPIMESYIMKFEIITSDFKWHILKYNFQEENKFPRGGKITINWNHDNKLKNSKIISLTFQSIKPLLIKPVLKMNNYKPNLIYDVGMHIGEDTDFYLKKGFKVIAIEANPSLVKQCEEKFFQYIKNKQLIILNLGITKENGKFTFYINDDLTEWSSFNKKWATHEGNYHTIEIECLKMERILLMYGIPYYLKIDIEGYDFIALESIKKFETKPKYISVENGGKIFLDFFIKQGYTKFKFINQKYINEQTPPFPALEGNYVAHKFPWGSSGLFGKETPGEWKNYDDVLKEMNAYWENPRRDPNIDGWYDLHATLD